MPPPRAENPPSLAPTEDSDINAAAQDLTRPALPRQPRAQGELVLSARLRGGQSRIGALRQQGSLKALFPHGSGAALKAVFLNTGGGVTGGDRFSLRAEAEPGASLTLTSQAAERIYRAQPGEVGRVATRLAAGAGATLHWLPQETIVFEGATLERRIDAELDETASFLAVEPLIFGRAAMNERVHDARLEDRWRIRRGGELVFADTLRLAGDIDALLCRPGVADGARAMASVLLVRPHAGDMAAPLRAAIGPQGACSQIRPGVLFARILAEDGFALRRRLIPAIRLLAGGDIPRPWML